LRNLLKPNARDVHGAARMTAASLAMFLVLSGCDADEVAARAILLIRLTDAEAIALHYYRAAHLEGWTALMRAIADALADLDAAEARTAEQGRLIPHGYARGLLND
jgi:hypothetical protein